MDRPIIDRICELYALGSSLMDEAKTEAKEKGLFLIDPAVFNPMTRNVVIQLRSGAIDRIANELGITPQSVLKYGFIRKTIFYKGIELFEIREAAESEKGDE